MCAEAACAGRPAVTAIAVDDGEKFDVEAGAAPSGLKGAAFVSFIGGSSTERSSGWSCSVGNSTTA